MPSNLSNLLRSVPLVAWAFLCALIVVLNSMRGDWRWTMGSTIDIILSIAAYWLVFAVIFWLLRSIFRRLSQH